MNNSQSNNSRGLLGDFLYYLYSPVYNIPLVRGGGFLKFRQIFKLWSFSIVVAGIFGIFISLILSLLNIQEIDNFVVDFFIDQPLYVFLLLALLWAPITEELTFRLGLKYSPLKLGISLAFIVSLIISFLLKDIESFFPQWFLSFIENNGLYVYLFFVVFFSVIFSCIIKKKLTKERVQKIYTKRFNQIFYVSIIFFAVVHIFNFYNTAGIWYILPLLAIPQLIFGALFSYIRMRYGITWSILGHFLHNGMASLPLIAISLMSPEYIRIMEEGGNISEQKATSQPSLFPLFFSFVFILITVAIIVSVIKLIIEYFQRKRARRF